MDKAEDAIQHLEEIEKRWADAGERWRATNEAIAKYGGLTMSEGGVPYYYKLGYADLKAGRKIRLVPQNFKLAYLNGRTDAREGKEPRYK